MQTGVLSLTVHTSDDVRVRRPDRGIKVIWDREWQGFEFLVRVPRGTNKADVNARAARLRQTGLGVTFHPVRGSKYRVRLSGPTVRTATRQIMHQPTLGTFLLVGALGLAGHKGPAEICAPFKTMVNEVILG